MCGYTRSRRDRCFKPDADYGYGAAKDEKYYGFKLSLRIARSDMITHFSLLPARSHDLQLLGEWVEGCVGLVPADKAFIDRFRQALVAERHRVVLIFSRAVVGYTFDWQCVTGGGTVNSSGLFTSTLVAGTSSNTVQAGTDMVTGFATVTVNALPPMWLM